MLDVPWGSQSTWGASSKTIYSTSLLEKYLRSTTVPCLYTATRAQRITKILWAIYTTMPPKNRKMKNAPKLWECFWPLKLAYIKLKIDDHPGVKFTPLSQCQATSPKCYPTTCSTRSSNLIVYCHKIKGWLSLVRCLGGPNGWYVERNKQVSDTLPMRKKRLRHEHSIMIGCLLVKIYSGVGWWLAS